MPPKESGLPAGVAPEAITNPALRAKYEEAIAANRKLANKRNHQLMLRELARRFPKDAEDYLIKVYSQSPNRIAELSEYLRTYGIDHVTSKRIVHEVEKRIRSAQ
jgi:spore germination cell wall hydrolase CwlJ-like protein